MKNISPTRFEVAVLVIMAGIIAYQLFIPPLIGLADNGDFGRFLPYHGLEHVPTDRKGKYFDHFNSKYRFVPALTDPNWYVSSTSLLITAARWAAVGAGQRELFDIRILAALYMLTFLFGIWLVLVAMRPLSFRLRATLSALLAIIFTDVGYIAYFNSFYSEGTALAFLTIGIGCSLILISKQSSSALLLIGYFLAIGMAITSKPMYVSLIPVFALFGIYISRYLRFTRRYWLGIGLTIALCFVSFFYHRQTHRSLVEASVYVGVFMDLLPHSSNPRQDLIDLGLNPDYAVFSKSTPFQADSPLIINPKFRVEFYQKAKSYTLPLFYLTHPGRLYELCVRCMRNAFTNRDNRLGFYEARAGKPIIGARAGKPIYAKPFGIWSSIRERVFPKSVFFLSLFFATGIAAIASLIKYPQLRSMCLLYLLFLYIAIIQFFVAVTVGGGEPDVAKHLYMFNLAFDVSFILWVFGATHLLKTFRPSLYKTIFVRAIL